MSPLGELPHGRRSDMCRSRRNTWTVTPEFQTRSHEAFPATGSTEEHEGNSILRSKIKMKSVCVCVHQFRAKMLSTFVDREMYSSLEARKYFKVLSLAWRAHQKLRSVLLRTPWSCRSHVDAEAWEKQEAWAQQWKTCTQLPSDRPWVVLLVGSPASSTPKKSEITSSESFDI